MLLNICVNFQLWKLHRRYRIRVTDYRGCAGKIHILELKYLKTIFSKIMFVI